MNKILIISAVSWILFFIEAILSFSVGKMKENELFKIVLPSKKELIKLVIILLIFSVLNGIVTANIQNFL